MERQSGFNALVLSHDYQAIKHLTGGNFNPGEKRTSNPVNDYTWLN